MSDPNLPDLDSLIRAEVDRSVTPYVGKHPAFMIAKLRERRAILAKRLRPQ